jgi:hypothetical protein
MEGGANLEPGRTRPNFVSFEAFSASIWEGNGMLLEAQRKRIVEVGLEALRRGIVHGTAGNFSERDRESGLIAI